MRYKQIYIYIFNCINQKKKTIHVNLYFFSILLYDIVIFNICTFNLN